MDVRYVMSMEWGAVCYEGRRGCSILWRLCGRGRGGHSMISGWDGGSDSML